MLNEYYIIFIILVTINIYTLYKYYNKESIYNLIKNNKIDDVKNYITDRIYTETEIYDYLKYSISHDKENIFKIILKENRHIDIEPLLFYSYKMENYNMIKYISQIIYKNNLINFKLIFNILKTKNHKFINSIISSNLNLNYKDATGTNVLGYQIHDHLNSKSLFPILDLDIVDMAIKFNIDPIIKNNINISPVDFIKNNNIKKKIIYLYDKKIESIVNNTLSNMPTDITNIILNYNKTKTKMEFTYEFI
jgi:hypothetical protein